MDNETTVVVDVETPPAVALENAAAPESAPPAEEAPRERPARKPQDPAKAQAAAERRAVQKELRKLAKSGTREELFAKFEEISGKTAPVKVPPAVVVEAPKLSTPPPEGWPSDEARAAALNMILPFCLQIAQGCEGTRFAFPPTFETELPVFEQREGGKIEQTGTRRAQVNPVVQFAEGLAPFVAMKLGAAGGVSPGALALVTVGSRFGPGAVSLGVDLAAPHVMAWWDSATSPKQLTEKAK